MRWQGMQVVLLAVRAIVLAAVFAAAGCVSIVGRTTGMTWGHPYVNTMLALGYAPQQPLLFVDAPLDFVLDTALLPMDLLLMPFVKD